MRCLILLPLIISCHSTPKPSVKIIAGKNKDSVVVELDVSKYPETKKNIVLLVKNQHSENFNEAYSKLFVNAVTDSIIPYWYGTKWNFYGNTETPQQGTIACGYFVTTVLRDAGCPINRVKLAQYPSEKIITSLVSKKSIRRYSNVPLNEFIDDIKKQGEGLFVIGLDNHVGFLLNDDKGVWFIHSSYINPGCVAKQDATNNSILYYSKYRITGKISADDNFLRSWQKNMQSKRL
ncbi:MAG: hypothetical protein HYR66_06480 [Sphingobacteriales bacterium]|nr:hypothetical protein [Sphingobacteriales bacterium]MBI3720264.1 hypothetical protein [Sphingobacteriales bacterium]